MNIERFIPIKKGEIFWTLTLPDGSEKSGKLINKVTLDSSVVIARLMSGASTNGVVALAVGTGDGAWDPLNPPAATKYQRSLYNEISRKAYSSTQFIDSSGTVSVVPTNIVDYIFTFGASEAVGQLTEMGLLGGDINSNMAITNPITPPNGSYDPTVDITGKDALINYITFPVITKPVGSTLSWTWRLTF